MKKMRFTNKGQAALEFIMTYGWAILVVLVAIGALAYFGVLSPDKLLPNKCLMTSGLSCDDARVSRNSIQMKLTNSLGQDLKDINMHNYGCINTAIPVTGIPHNCTGPSSLNNGQAATWTCTCTAGLGGTKYSSSVGFYYTSIDSNIAHAVNGTIIQRIE